MESIKRIEIIADSILITDVIAALEDCGMTGYTLIKDVTGRGERGKRSGDDPAGITGNALLITTCPVHRLQEIVNAIRPYLKSQGGVCLVSDAHWVIH